MYSVASNEYSAGVSFCFHVKSLSGEWVMNLLIKSLKVSVGVAEVVEAEVDLAIVIVL